MGQRDNHQQTPLTNPLSTLATVDKLTSFWNTILSSCYPGLQPLTWKNHLIGTHLPINLSNYLLVSMTVACTRDSLTNMTQNK
ncbi:hypothetical protein ATANTOWER_032901 [Ataeniobius toweri]|uniref:Uncharacterized protein n=1 Tax=Ataeniobius toweri TaxID=208326 RepID=A0ABU7C6I2_9TELE|nr:hypothetical protein [Ataeniobius toweri]